MGSRKHNRPSATRDIVIDTNIVVYVGKNNKDLANKVLACLRDAVTKDYVLTISDFTIFELLKGASPESEGKALASLQGIKRYYVTKRVLVAAAHLECIYQQNKIPKESIDSGDKIIGATAVLTNSLIFTANTRDFPRPFFKEILAIPIVYSKDGKQHIINTAFLEPDINTILSHHKMWQESLRADDGNP